MIEVISKIYSKVDKVEELINLFKKMTEPTRREKGYILYEMYQDKEVPEVLIVTEQWKTLEDFDNHCHSQHFRYVVPRMEECMSKESEVHICKLVVS